MTRIRFSVIAVATLAFLGAFSMTRSRDLPDPKSDIRGSGAKPRAILSLAKFPGGCHRDNHLDGSGTSNPSCAMVQVSAASRAAVARLYTALIFRRLQRTSQGVYRRKSSAHHRRDYHFGRRDSH